MKKAATNVSLDKTASAELTAETERKAMLKTDINIANSVLPFLASESSAALQSVIEVAGKAANCGQIIGCCGSGIFAEEDWLLDAPAGAANLFGDDIYLAPMKNRASLEPLLTLTAPNPINSSGLNSGNKRYGGVSENAIDQDSFSVWQNVKAG